MDDGSYFDIYEHPVYHFIQNLEPPPQSSVGWKNAAAAQGTCSMAHGNYWVARSTVNTTFRFTPSAGFPSFAWGLGDYIVYEYHDPYELPNYFNLVQHKKEPSDPAWSYGIGGPLVHPKWLIFYSYFELDEADDVLLYRERGTIT